MQTDNKKKILFMTEASYLNTGYAKYGREVISRIFNSNKYNIAEFSTYGDIFDKRRNDIPWKNYPNLPNPNDKKSQEIYNSNPINQFGAWRFDRACLDFKPDIVFTIRDFWMDSFIYQSPFRRIFSWCWMPTVDAFPQNPEWLDMFSDADYVLTYSDWAKTVIEKQGGNTINTIASAPPSASLEFLPMDKNQVRSEFNIDSEIKIIGTVMRNQRRKLFPALLESFSKYIKEHNKSNVFLYLHTSFPDAGWDLSELIQKYEISNRVLMTYVCEKCKHVEVSLFREAKKGCAKCGAYASTPSNVGNGVNDATLAKIYNTFDLYIQLANSEGFGLPQVEAAACGIPIACTNYSAMEDIVNKLNALPIKYSLYKELETSCNRAVPRIDSIVDTFVGFFNLSNDEQKSRSIETRNLFEKHYNWDKTADTWMKIADQCKYADWQQPAMIKMPPPRDMEIPHNNNYEYVSQLFNIFSYYEPFNNSYAFRSILTDLNRGTTRSSHDGFYSSQFSPLNDTRPRQINKQMIQQAMYNRLINYNNWEQLRVDPDMLAKKGDNDTWL